MVPDPRIVATERMKKLETLLKDPECKLRTKNINQDAGAVQTMLRFVSRKRRFDLSQEA